MVVPPHIHSGPLPPAGPTFAHSAHHSSRPQRAAAARHAVARGREGRVGIGIGVRGRWRSLRSSASLLSSSSWPLQTPALAAPQRPRQFLAFNPHHTPVWRLRQRSSEMDGAYTHARQSANEAHGVAKELSRSRCCNLLTSSKQHARTHARTRDAFSRLRISSSRLLLLQARRAG